MSPLKAKALKNSLRVLIICSLTPPFVAVSNRTFDAKLEDPVERTFIIRTLYVEVKQMWIIDPSTGEVFGRFDKVAQEIRPAGADTHE
jgi:hypothetical protein